MPIQQKLIMAVKRRVARGGRRPVRVKAGPARGCSMMLDRRVDMQRELGLYESETHSAVRTLVGAGSVVIDIGAGDGYESLAFARLGARVLAFEPDSDAVALLRQNLGLNPCLSGQVTVFPESFPPADPAPHADFAKVDVDGGERDLLAHLMAVPTILIETHSPDLESGCIAFLREHGYRTTVIANARWRRAYPEWRPIGFNRWLLAER